MGLVIKKIKQTELQRPLLITGDEGHFVGRFEKVEVCFFGLERDETSTSPVPFVPHEWQNQEKTSLMAELSCFLVNLGRLCSDGGRQRLSKKGKITGFWPTCLDLLKVI